MKYKENRICGLRIPSIKLFRLFYALVILVLCSAIVFLIIAECFMPAFRHLCRMFE